MEDSKIFEEDVVMILDKDGKTGNGKIKYGLVMESSEYISSDDEDNDDDEEDSIYQKVRQNTVRVAWHPEGKSQVVEESKLQLADRSLMPGEIVRRLIQGQDSQRGYVSHTKVKCHLQVIGRRVVICDVDSADLIPFYAFDVESGDVYLDSWVGKIERITERVVLRFCDGARCELNTEDLIGELTSFEDLMDKRDRDSEFSLATFYVGQLLRGELGSLDGATWIKSTKNFSQTTTKKNRSREVVVTVEKADVGSVEVNWLCRGYTKAELTANGMNPPPTIVTRKDLHRMKQMHCFEASSVQLGDKNYYVLKDTDNKIVINDSKSADSRSVMDIILNRSDRTVSDCLLIEGSSKSNSWVSVSSQEDITKEKKNYQENGKVQETAVTSEPSEVILKKKRTKGLQMRPLKKKKLKPAKAKLEDISQQFSEPKAGDQVPVEIISTSTLVDVIWQDGSTELGIPSTHLFPIHHLDELEFFPGDFVFSASDVKMFDVYGVVQSVEHTGRTCTVQWMKHGNGTKPDEVLNKEDVSVYDIKEHPDLRYRPGNVVVRVGGFEEPENGSDVSSDHVLTAGGQVYELSCDGHLLVEWADKTRSRCYPLELYLVGDEMSDLDSSENSSSDSDDESEDDEKSSQGSACSWEWETEEEEMLPVDTEIKEGIISETANGICKSQSTVNRDAANEFLEAAQMTLHKLEETMEPRLSEATSSSGLCGRDVLHLYRDCRNIDRVLASSFFDNTELVEAVSDLRKGLKKDKMHHLNKQVMELFESNCKQLKVNRRSKDTVDRDSIGAVGGNHEESGMDSGVGKSPSSMDNLTELKDLICCNDACYNGTSQGVVFSSLSGDSVDSAKLNSLESNVNMVSNMVPESNANPESNTKLKMNKELESNMNLGSSTDFVSSGVAQEDTRKHADTQTSEINRDSQILCKVIVDILKRLLFAENGLLHSFCNILLDAKTSVETEKGVIVPDELSKSTSTNNNGEILPTCIPSALPVPTPCKNDYDLELTRISLPEDIAPSTSDDKLPQTPVEIRSKIEFNEQGYTVMEAPSDNHHFMNAEHQPTDMKSFMTAVRKELKLLQTCLPKGIYVKGYESRLDLFTVMIRGPSRTPYEDGLFFFDVQLPVDYPKSPPVFFYISYCTDRLNPNLYEDGKVCVSLLGTWSGKGTEVWSSTKSNLLQVLISIQGLILNPEPYYNEAGYERQKGSQQGLENSRMYNEMAIVKMIQSMIKMAGNPCGAFQEEIRLHMETNACRMINRLRHWLNVMPAVCGTTVCLTPVKKNGKEMSPESMQTPGDTQSESACKQIAGAFDDYACDAEASKVLNGLKLPSHEFGLPDFPLLPVSKGLKLTLSKCLDLFKISLESIGIKTDVQ